MSIRRFTEFSYEIEDSAASFFWICLTKTVHSCTLGAFFDLWQGICSHCKV